MIICLSFIMSFFHLLFYILTFLMSFFLLFLLNDTATTEIYTLSLHDALPISQGKSNADIAIITGASEKTVKNHLTHVFEKLGVEGRNAATVRALEVLSAPASRQKTQH